LKIVLLILKEDKVNCKVSLSASAEEDLFEIYKYIYQNDSEENADNVYSELRKKCFSLQDYSNRGHVPNEMALFGLNDFLEIIHKPFRIIYQTIGKEIFIHCVLDGRRDMQKLLHERLMR